MPPTVSQAPPVCRPIPPFKTPFKVFVACEDQAAFFHARKVQAQVESSCGAEFEISRVFWNFALFRHEKLWKQAVLEASRSEMIVVSLCGTNDLPPHVKLWVENWPIRSQTSRAALVILLGPEHDASPGWPPHLAWLRQIAESRGMDFFCNQNGWQLLDFASLAAPRLEGWDAPPENFISPQIPWPRGGLNE